MRHAGKLPVSGTILELGSRKVASLETSRTFFRSFSLQQAVYSPSQVVCRGGPAVTLTFLVAPNPVLQPYLLLVCISRTQILFLAWKASKIYFRLRRKEWRVVQHYDFLVNKALTVRSQTFKEFRYQRCELLITRSILLYKLSILHNNDFR